MPHSHFIFIQEKYVIRKLSISELLDKHFNIKLDILLVLIINILTYKYRGNVSLITV